MRDRELLGIAWFCWAAPAVVGVGTTILFLLTDVVFFALLGLLCALFGTMLFVLGIAMVVSSQSGPRVLLALLLFSNFPLAIACASVGTNRIDASMPDD
jgi:hypothetical protein